MPKALYPDPFRGAPNKLALCDAYNYDAVNGKHIPANTNFRYFAEKIMKAAIEAGEDPWFGSE